MKKVISSLVISGLCANGACSGMNEDLAKNEVEAITEKAGKNLMVKEIKRAEKNNRKVRTVLGISIAAAGSAFAYHYLRATKNPTVGIPVVETILSVTTKSSPLETVRSSTPKLSSSTTVPSVTTKSSPLVTVHSLTKVLNFAKNHPLATSLPTIGGLASIAVATAYFIKKKSADSGKVEDRACISRYISDTTKGVYLKIQELRESVFEYFESKISLGDLSNEKDGGASPGEDQTSQNQGDTKGQPISIIINGKPKTLIKSEDPMRNEQEIYQELTELNKELNKDWASLSGSEMDLAKFQELDSKLDSISDKLEGCDYISKCVYDKFSQASKKLDKLFSRNFIKYAEICKNSVCVMKGDNPSTEETEVFQELTELNEDLTSLSGSKVDLSKLQELRNKFDSILDKIKDHNYISECVTNNLDQVTEKIEELFDQNFIKDIKINGNSIHVMKGKKPSTEENEVFQESVKLLERLESSSSEVNPSKLESLLGEFRLILDKLRDRDYISECVDNNLNQISEKIKELKKSIDNRNKTSGKNGSERSAFQIPLFWNTNNIRGHETVYVNSSSAIK